MCVERDITFVDHTDTIDIEITTDNGGNTTLGSDKSLTVSGVSNLIPEHNHEVSQSDSFRNSSDEPVLGDPIFKEPQEIPSNLNKGALPEPRKASKNIRSKNINRLMFSTT